MIATSIKSVCMAVLLVAGINSFALGQSSVTDDQTQMTITSMTVCGDNIFAGMACAYWLACTCLDFPAGKYWQTHFCSRHVSQKNLVCL